MQLFPRDSHGLACLQVAHAARDFFVPLRLNRFVRLFEAIEKSIGQRSALVNRERECPFQKIGPFWTHVIILPRVVYSANVVYESVKGKPHFSQRTREMGHPAAEIRTLPRNVTALRCLVCGVYY